jgi:hypothetical protein
MSWNPRHGKPIEKCAPPPDKSIIEGVLAHGIIVEKFITGVS